MKITLIQPCLSTSDRYGKALGKVGPTTEPLGLAYLAGYLKKYRNDSVEIIDAVALDYSSEDLIAHIDRSKPDIVGVSISTPMYLRAKETIRILRENFGNNIKIIVGGPHVTIFPKQTLEENKDIDLALYGEAEASLMELLNALENETEFSNVKGLVYRSGDEVIVNPPMPYFENIDEIPLPARDLLQMDKYKPAPTYHRRLPCYIILTVRGCPYRCSYCSKTFGKVVRLHSIPRVIEEMKVLIDEYHTKEIIFRDDTFTVKKKHTEELCNEIIRQGLHKKIKWSCTTRVNLVTLPLLKLMKKAGCWSIHYGVESSSQRLLDLIKKDITIEQIKNAMKWTKQVGIETKAYFMVGLPTETKEETLQTIKFTKELDPDWIQVTITVPYPGTELFEIAKSDGTLKSFKWENYQTWASWADTELVYIPSGRNEKELKALQKRAMREFYVRPKFILKQLLYIRSFHRLRTFINGAYALFLSKFK